MKTVPIIGLLFQPGAVREMVAETSELAAVAVNAAIGLCVVAALSLSMLAIFTPLLVAAMIVLFGPFVGFVISSIFTRVEWVVGARLGGVGGRDELYRLFSWSFLPAGCGVLLSGLILSMFPSMSTAGGIAASLPLLVLACCALRNYGVNIAAFRQLSKSRAAANVALSIVLSVALITGAGALLVVLVRYGMGDYLTLASQVG